MARLILDAMGGDLGPRIALEGALQALPEIHAHNGLEGRLWIVGDEAILRPLLAKRRFKNFFTQKNLKVELIHAPDVIEMHDSIKAVRAKPKASLNVGIQLAAQHFAEGNPSAFVSTGHSGAVMTSALLNMGRIKGIERPAIAIRLPSLSEDGCVFLDVGANVECKPEHLLEFGMMGALYSSAEKHSPGLPKVGILSNGEERSKGTALTRAALELYEKEWNGALAKDVGQFIGYCEGKDIFKGTVQVVVTDGFTGNVVLKALEGLGSAVVNLLKTEAKASILHLLGTAAAAPVLSKLKRRLDYAEYGAAPLLGVSGYVFICHGRSNSKAIKNALLRAQSTLEHRLVERLKDSVSLISVAQNGS